MLSVSHRRPNLGVAKVALRRTPLVLRLRIASPLPELAPPSLLSGGEPVLSLLETLLVLRRAARDPEVAAIAVRMEGPPGGLARASTLRRALADAAAEKPVVVWAESLTSEELLAASGTPLFVSADPAAVGPEQRTALAEAFSRSAAAQPLAEPLDWLETTCPRHWRFGTETREFDWGFLE